VEGTRGSTAYTYLRPAIRRGANIDLRLHATMTGLIMEGNRVGGVCYTSEDLSRKAHARRGVILCAGALATPKLLMLSGIGPAEHLKQLGIPVVQNLRGVGQNYQDHLEISVYLKTTAPISLLGQDKGLAAIRNYLNWKLFRTGVLTTNVVESGAFIDTDGDGRADIQFHVLPALGKDYDRDPLPGHGLSINPCTMRPKSRGSVRLRSADPVDKIIFNANPFGDEDDLRILVEGLKWARKIARSPSLAKLVETELLPHPADHVEDDVLVEHTRRYAKTVYHPSCTCRMGTGADAVVDPKLAVHGVTNLWIADASVMPSIVSGNTNAPTIMIAERCADFLRSKAA
jgi:choline dehydrogenase